MKIKNENASCYTCKYCLDSTFYQEITVEQKKERQKACKKCANQNGHLGWFPSPDVKVQETKGWTFTGTRKPVETLFRKVLV